MEIRQLPATFINYCSNSVVGRAIAAASPTTKIVAAALAAFAFLGIAYAAVRSRKKAPAPKAPTGSASGGSKPLTLAEQLQAKINRTSTASRASASSSSSAATATLDSPAPSRPNPNQRPAATESAVPPPTTGSSTPPPPPPRPPTHEELATAARAQAGNPAAATGSPAANASKPPKTSQQQGASPQNDPNLAFNVGLREWWNDAEALGDKAKARENIKAAFKGKSIGLDLSGLELTKLPACIGMLSNLHHLILANNKLVDLPGELSQLPLLETINVTGNPDIVIPENLKRFVTGA